MVTRGPIHEYLGMTLDFTSPGKCRVGMDGYVEELVEEFLVDTPPYACTPAAAHLFEDNQQQNKLNETEATTFHQPGHSKVVIPL